ncbi:hypothetical protein [Actinacidiphila glaucinigra]|uniref:hypothetical protein n=1 Tax=Actinacidiphila glaucinigra TaxID=235986 RepID=UPI00371856F0
MALAELIGEVHHGVEDFGAHQVRVEGSRSRIRWTLMLCGNSDGVTGRESMPRARVCTSRPSRPPRIRWMVCRGRLASRPTVFSPYCSSVAA